MTSEGPWSTNAVRAKEGSRQARARAAEAGERAAQIRVLINQPKGSGKRQPVSDKVTLARAGELAILSEQRSLATFESAAEQHERLAAWHDRSAVTDTTRARWHQEQAARHHAATAEDRMTVFGGTFEENALILARRAADEYRCDIFANEIIGRFEVTIGEGEPEPLTLHHLRGDAYQSQLAVALDDRLHPGLADIVQEYREGRVELEPMLHEVARQTGEALVLIAHAEATSASNAGPAILDLFNDHPAVALYLKDAWSPIQRALRSDPSVPMTADSATRDEALSGASAGIVQMWRTLGLRGSVTSDNQLRVEVGAPRRR